MLLRRWLCRDNTRTVARLQWLDLKSSNYKIAVSFISCMVIDYVYLSFTWVAPSFVRLVDGAIVSSGRVEIYHKGEWGSVCREGWDQASSSVACRELGYEKATSGANRGSVKYLPLCIELHLCTCFWFLKQLQTSEAGCPLVKTLLRWILRSLEQE